MLFDWIVFLNKILCQRYHQRFATFEFRIGWRLWACNQAFYQYCSGIFGRERVKSMNSDGIAHHYCSFNFCFFAILGSFESLMETFNISSLLRMFGRASLCSVR